MSQKVFVQSMRGEPLMPTRPAKARHLLEEGKAEVVEREPFTIRLKYATGENKQEIKLGIDAGYSTVGFSAVTEKEELIAGRMELRNDISKKLEQRKKYRRARRHRKTRYREPRFNNRKKNDGWLAPSIEHKKDAHLKLVRKIEELLPISEVRVEVATFDTQKMQNPEISGAEYQHGTLEGYHVKEYLLEKWNRKCAYCGKTDVPLEVDHIVPKSRGGSDRVPNLTISCRNCNQEKNGLTAEEFGYPESQEKAEKSLKEAAFMNQVRWQMISELGCDYTYGYITKKKRIDLGLEKSDVNDAFVIAGGKSQKRSAREYNVYQRRRNNRSIQMNRKGYGRSVRTERYDLQPGDIVEKDGVEAEVKGVFNYGRYVRIDHKHDDYWKTEDVKLVRYGKGLQFN